MTVQKTISKIFLFVAFSVLIAGASIVAQEKKQDVPQVEKTVPVFKDGLAQVVPGFENRKDWIQHELFVETEFDSDSNGKKDRMHVSVTRPKQTDTEGLKVPVIYETSPYYCGTAGLGKFFWDPKHELGDEPPERKEAPSIKQKLRKNIASTHNQWVKRGFAVVHSCSPGTGKSQGCPTVGGKNESLAPKAVIDWLCGRAKGYTKVDGDEEVKATWCTGKVGMTGTSYNGTLPIAAATTGVEGLECIIPVAPNTSYYHYYRANGLIRHPGGYMGEDIDVLYDFINSGNPEMRDKCNCDVRDELMQKNFDRIDGDYNDFWASRDYSKQLKNFKAAALMAHGLNDWNVMPSHTTRIYQALRKKGLPCQIYLHQGGHGGPPPQDMMNRWFTHYLYGIENGVEKDPRSWIVREKADRNKPESYAEYPNPEASPVTFYLNKGGSKVGKLTTTATTGQGQEKIVDDVAISGKKLAQADESEHRLLFATAELTEPVHISGTSKMTVRIASSKPAANLSIWVVSLPYTNSRSLNDNIITRGWADLQNHKSLTESEDLVPGKFYEMTFILEPDDQIIPKGQKIGVMIFSSDRDFTLWPEKGTELTVDLDKTKIEMPIVGGEKAFAKAASVKTSK